MIREKLKVAGVHGDPAYIEAAKRLRDVKHYAQAVPGMTDAAVGDVELLLSLIGGRNAVERLCAAKLKQVWDDMHGTRPQAGADEAGLRRVEAHLRGTRPSAQQTPGWGQSTVANNGQILRSPGPAPRPGGVGQPRSDNQRIFAHPSGPKDAYIKAVRSQSKILANSLMQTLKVRDGRPIGNVPWRDLEKLRDANATEAAILDRIWRKGVPSDPDALVSDILREEDLQQIVAEVSDGA